MKRTGILVGILVSLICASTCRADDPPTLEVEDGPFKATLVLTEDKDMIDRVRFGAHGDRIREMCPLCAYVADNTETRIFLPLVVEWEAETDLSTFHPDVWAQVSGRWYKLKELILPTPKGEKMDMTVFKPSISVANGKFAMNQFVPESVEANDNRMVGLAGFARTKRFKLDKIEAIQFTADREARKLKK